MNMTKEKISQIRAGLRTVLSQLSRGERAYVESLFNKALGYLSRGEVDAAKETIATYPCPTNSLIAARDRALAIFPASE